MSKTRYRNNIPPGLRAQIAFAVILTLGALLVLPTALSARQSATTTTAISVKAPSAGSVVTSMQDFHTATFAAAAFNDWD
ncbi:MAG: hypothetical protein ACR2PI_25595 [Hyphomicrobiaceae bacterium]